MTILQKFKISGAGKFMPHKIVSNDEIEHQIGIRSGWISKYLGVETRHKATTETNTSMAHEALKAALLCAKLEAKELDCIIGASATFDYVLPNRSSLIKHSFVELADRHIPCLDINTVCTSFITALDYAARLVQESQYNHIAIVSSEIASHGLNKSDAKTYSLFGDGAAAVIVSKTTENFGTIKYSLNTYSEGTMDTIIRGGGNRHHPKNVAYDTDLFSFKMEGNKLLKQAKKYIPHFFDGHYANVPFSLDTVNCIIPHQASKAGLQVFFNCIKNKNNYIANEVAQYGNCIAASIPIALTNAIQNGNLKQGDSCLIAGTAAGLSICGLTFMYGTS
jgi:3-oxoacyl-[acyl-carrier-protein] synthase III